MSTEETNWSRALSDKYEQTQDFIKLDLLCGDYSLEVYRLKTLTDDQMLQQRIIRPFYELREPELIKQYFQSVSERHTESPDVCADAVSQGRAVVRITGCPAYLLDIEHKTNTQTAEANIESVIQGPRNAFSEDIETNLNIIRSRYPGQRLHVEMQALTGDRKTRIALVYDLDTVNNNALELLREKLKQSQLNQLLAAGQLMKMITDRNRSLFPNLMITERPDRVQANLNQGKIALIVQGTPFVLVGPAVFYDFISSMEDLYQSYWISKFLVFLRYFGMLVSITLPGLYVSISAYNPEILRVQLALSVAGSRAGVPYPAFIEVLFMLLAMELLIEASIRLPKTIGSTATTVGGLILGQAATEAGLVSDIMVIIVAAVAIANFVIPINAMSFAMRMIKYVVLMFSILYGMIGLVFSFIGMVAYLVYLDSLGEPFLRVYKKDDQSLKGDVV